VLRSLEKPEGFGHPEAEEGNLLADRTAAIAGRRIAQGKFFSIENPETSFLWMLKSIKQLTSLEGVNFVVLHQCAYGGPYYKPTGVLTNAPWMCKIAKLCHEVAPHWHTTLKGRVWSYALDKEVWYTSEGAEYPHGLCQAWAAACAEFVVQSCAEEPVCEANTQRVGRFSNALVRVPLKNGETKKQKRERENLEHLGGMRNPNHAVALVQGWRDTGFIVSKVLDELLVEGNPFEKVVTLLRGEKQLCNDTVNFWLKPFWRSKLGRTSH
jgi:hypothetical protein